MLLSRYSLLFRPCLGHTATRPTSRPEMRTLLDVHIAHHNDKCGDDAKCRTDTRRQDSSLHDKAHGGYLKLAGTILLTSTTESEVERAEQMLRRQLGKSTERTKKLREQSGHKGHMAKEKTHELRAMHKRLAETEKTRWRCGECASTDGEEDARPQGESLHTAYGEGLKMGYHQAVHNGDGTN
ncbi:hypothetical protein Purlil1_13409 [Purpureocillium lilacinum]|uniref:Uncharacterized protein n=1 Tax=Purpureocillium lilacinum TaxID=33203 RepID=A0ABR0BEC3_PURLI|nr:hypothetical protein Purlil1_13409 [Purpureocillium lilacinum]